MSLRINDIAPDFTAETTQGPIHFHEWIGDRWAVLFSHPKDFTPVCTTELGAVANLQQQFAQRGAKVIGLSVDKVGDHDKWQQDIQDVSGATVNFPMIGDPELKVAKLYDMLPADAGETSEGRTPANNAPVRTVFIHRTGQEDQADSGVPYDIQAPRRHSRQLETGRRRDHHGRSLQRGRSNKVPGLQNRQTLSAHHDAAKLVFVWRSRQTRQHSRMSTGGEVANALVCKTSIRRFDPDPVLHNFFNSLGWCPERVACVALRKCRMP